jgi:Tol biopolymer transport system component
MNTSPDIESVLDTWLGEGRDVLPGRSIQAVLATVRRTPQRSVRRSVWRTADVGPIFRLASVLGVMFAAVLATGALILSLGGNRPSIVGPAASSTAGPATPSVTPALAGRIAFVRDGLDQSGGSKDIWVANADGSDPRRLTDHPGPDERPVWSPDATRIAFTVGDSQAQVMVMDADGSNQRQVTHNAFPAGRPTWSPDGTSLAFADASSGELYVIRADGTGQVRITQPPTPRSCVDPVGSCGGDVDPAWSPQGDRIAFVEGDSIWTIRPDGSDRRLFAQHFDGRAPGIVRRLAWSPDGKRIAANIDGLIWLEDARGETNLMTEMIGEPLSSFVSAAAMGPNADSPTWSPDGEWLAFGWFSDSDSSDSFGDIYVVNADGSGLRDVLPGSERDSQPAWSSR